MTLQRFIQDTLPGLDAMLRDPQCDHVLVSSEGTWHARTSGTWHTQDSALAADALGVLAQMCADSPEDDRVAQFSIHVLAHPSRRTIAFVRQSSRDDLTLTETMYDALAHAISQGHNGIILGPPSAPKEALLQELASAQKSPAIYVSARPDVPAPTLSVAPAHTPQARRHLRATLRTVEAAFWEGLHAPSELEMLWSHPGCQRRWCTMDATDPEIALQALSELALLLPSQTLGRLVWVEPYYHGDVPPIVLDREQGTWRTASSSALSGFLVELANRHLSSSERALAPPPEVTPEPKLDPASLTLQVDSEPSEVAIERGGFAELLQTHVTPDNHLLSTHPGFGSRSIQEDSDSGIVLPSPVVEASAVELSPLPQEPASEPVLSLDDFSEEPEVSFEELDPELILDEQPEEAVETNEYDPYGLPHDPLAVTTALPSQSDEPLTLEAPGGVLDELARELDEPPVDATMPISRDAISAQYDDLLAPLDEDEAALGPAPYEELKRMERELMTASHDEPTGIHPDFLDAPSPAAHIQNEDEISTSVKGTTDMTLPDDPEVFSSLNAQPQPPRQPPSAPDGVWQPAIADEPTQITFEHTNFASQAAEAPNLSWGDDENTVQRQQGDVAMPPPSNVSSDTSSKLNTLSDRIKALREKQRLSGQFDALPNDDV